MKKMFLALTCAILVTIACGTNSIAPTLEPNELQTVIVGTALAAQNQTEAAIIPSKTHGPTFVITPVPVVRNCLTGQEYYNQWTTLSNSMAAISFNLSDLWDTFNINHNVFLDPTWESEIESDAQEDISVAKEIQHLLPPKGWLVVSAPLNAAESNYIIGDEDLYNGVIQRDVGMINSDQSYYAIARNYMEEAKAAISETTNDNSCP
jgi:hypothetical protein